MDVGARVSFTDGKWSTSTYLTHTSPARHCSRARTDEANRPDGQDLQVGDGNSRALVSKIVAAPRTTRP